MREVTKKDVHFRWNEDEETAFQKVKLVIVESMTLSYFDTTKPITLQVDTSMKSFGATLLQEGRPVAYASKALTAAKTAHASKALTAAKTPYANIEREMLAVVFGCERFHNYVFGHKFFVHSHQKQLAAIHLKHLNATPPRQRRMLMRLQQ